MMDTERLIDWTNTIEEIKIFINTFEKDGKAIYYDQLNDLPFQNTPVKVFKIDFNHIAENDVLLDYMGEDIEKFINMVRQSVFFMYKALDKKLAKKLTREIRIVIRNYPNLISMREIDAKYYNKYVTIRGILIRMSAVEMIPLVLVFECPDHHYTIAKAESDFSMEVPTMCVNPTCGSKRLTRVNAVFMDYQILEIQERAEDLPAGMLPKTVSIFVNDELINSARMGDLIEVGGFVRSELSKKVKLGNETQTFRMRLYADYIDPLDKDMVVDISKEEIRKISDKSESKLTDLLVRSFAPNIQGNEIIKESILLTMISAETKTLDDGTNVRRDLNIFLLGDPGTAKSEMGKAAYRIAPKAFYSSGKGASGVGLTAATIKDNVTGAFMLEPGVLVLADGGLAVIDEFDKMRPEDRSALHEVLEQRSVSIAKGGINATLNARAAVIAIANPEYGKYDPYKSMIQNVPTIPIPLLTRFDLIFIVRDIPERERDGEIAKYIVRTHRTTSNPVNGNMLDRQMLSAYLQYAKTLRPELTEEAEDHLVQFYLKMRLNNEMEVITHRQLEGLIRIAIARAKLLLKTQADLYDAKRAIYIMTEMLKNSATNPNTGKIDMMEFNSGKDRGAVTLQQKFMDLFTELTVDGLVQEQDLLDEMKKTGKWSEIEAEKYLVKMSSGFIIYEPMPKKYKRVNQ